MRALTIAAMLAAGLISTVGISGSSVPVAHAAAQQTSAEHATAAR